MTAAKVETVSEDEQMSTKSLAMLAAILGALLFIGGLAPRGARKSSIW
jgi:hypothetical protein